MSIYRTGKQYATEAKNEKYDKLTSAIELSEKVFNKKYSDSDVDVEYDMDPMNVV